MTTKAKTRGETSAQMIQESSVVDLRRRAVFQEQVGNYWALKTRLLIDELRVQATYLEIAKGAIVEIMEFIATNLDSEYKGAWRDYFGDDLHAEFVAEIQAETDRAGVVATGNNHG